MKKKLWQPSEIQLKNNNMWRFIEFVNAQHHLNITTYQALYIWSITYPDEFWIAVWQFCHIKASHLWEHALVKHESMLQTQWFTSARLNFAENLLSRRDNKIALIFQNEIQQRREMSYHELYQQVLQLAQALQQAGVKPNDRIAAYMPNLPETIIAMLATASLGAIWSSCSPDFGIQGVIDRFDQIQPKILFTTDGHYYNGKIFDNREKITEIVNSLSSLEKIIVVPYINTAPDISHLPNSLVLENFISKNNITHFQFPQFAFNHPLYILFSSGTTGAPKCIVHGAGNTLLQHLKELILHTDLTSNDVIFYFTTCGWMMWNWLVSSLAVGATVVLYDGSPTYPSNKILFDLIDAEKISIFGTSAKFISSIEKSNLTPKQSHSLHSLKTMLSTGSPLLPENFDFVYEKIKSDLRLSSISGGTDIVSCFALGNPLLPVYRGELQSIGLGLQVNVFNEMGEPVVGEKGELVCTAPFPSMPIYFWNDPQHRKYHKAYFEKFINVWAHGDYAEITSHGGVIIYGRSDAVLNPGGVRIGTAEIYREVEKFPEIMESIAVAQEWQHDVRIILFVRLRPNIELSEELKTKIQKTIKTQLSPRHVPAKIIAVKDIPRTVSGKIVELAVREVIHNRPVKNANALANPGALQHFKNLSELMTE